MTWPAVATVGAAVVIIVGAGGWLANRRSAAPAPAAAAAPEPEQRDPEHRWVKVPAGEFHMGCVPGDVCAEDEQHRHKVRISRSYELTATEVTWGQYQRYAKAHNITPPPVPEYKIAKDYPVVNVTWEEASNYCKAFGGRLPTEAEWEYGARGGQQAWKRAWGSGDPMVNGHPAANLGDEAYRRETGMREIELTASPGDPPIWLGYDDGFGHAAPVATFAPNAFGLHDVSGNVQEWVSDFESENPDDYKAKGHEVDPTGPAKGERRGVRGDAFWFRPKWSRLSARQFAEPDRRESDLGFRCAR
jgi:formylglycine-generating enzyme